MKSVLSKAFVCLLILGAALAIFFILKFSKKEVVAEPVEVYLPKVKVVQARAEPFQLFVAVNGVVRPARETIIIPQVSGRIVSLSSSFFEGNRFNKGEELLSLEKIDFQSVLSLRLSDLAQAELLYEQELAHREQAIRDWERSGREGELSPLVARVPQLNQAKARLQSAKDAAALARENIKRTTITAPYAGRVLEKKVDLGQFVSAGVTNLARIYDDSKLEVALSLSDQEFNRLGIPYDYERSASSFPAVKVEFQSTMSKDDTVWSGHLDRISATMDAQTQLLQVVAVIDPEASSGQRSLKPGEFVSAKIYGKQLEDVYILPAVSLVGLSEIRVVDAENVLRKKSITIAQVVGDQVVVVGGIQEGDQVSVTPLDLNQADMKVDIDRL